MTDSPLRLLMALSLWAGSVVTPVARDGVTDPAVLVGAGDIASCQLEGDSATAALLDGIDGSVFALGDNVYDRGTAEEFAECYTPTWGRHKARTFPTPGNHEYLTEDAAGYFAYFGAAAGDPDEGYYSYDVGSWHIVVLNSNCFAVGGCDAGSEQAAWLREDLRRNSTDCTLAYWHYPRFSSGTHGGTLEMAPIWAILHNAGAEVAIAGHDHLYERFALQDAAGRPDPVRGIRQFIAGTGGASLYDFGEIAPNSEVRRNDTHGVLVLTLHSDRYDWEFVSTDRDGFVDEGTSGCH
jgi:hypothetical protein